MSLDVKLDLGLLNLVIGLALRIMWSIVIFDQNEIFVSFWSNNLLQNLYIISLNKSLVFPCVCIEVEGTLEVSTDGCKDMDNLIFVLKFVLSF